MGESVELPKRDLYIDGKWVPPHTGGRYAVVSPSTEQVIGSIPEAGACDINAAVTAACDAFCRNGGKEWSCAPSTVRAKFLRAIASKVRERKSELARWETLDCGKPIDEAEWDMDDVAGCFEYYANLTDELDKRQHVDVAVSMDTFRSYVRKEPIGVVALITPWNYPMLMATWKVAPALAAGCTVILKPSENASVTSLELGAIAEAVGLPHGVLNIVTGRGDVAGSALTEHPRIDKVAFTGGAQTGEKVMRAVAKELRPVTLELGGKSAMIVFDDVDIDKTVEWAMFGAFWTNGQICSATSRLLLHESIAERFLSRLVEWTKTIKITDPLSQGCRLGPVVNATQYKKVMVYIDKAKEEGALLLCGGKRPAHLPQGYYVEPTVFAGVEPHMQIWREEVFGPVLSVKTFRTEDEAIRLANDSVYGLAAAVMSDDRDRCRRVSEALQVGIVWLNCSQPCFTEAPWGGRKRSGFGRELGEWGLENYLSVKQVTEYTSKESWGWYPPPSKL
eukprot:TRINITY_DN1232_c0_g1_i3.p1 TRINITY_DN1232_c0_g1~~TRINITY_DN1232_c0_g1_i3.p1  ORF type:complete len:506 (+),score=91.76 TRINITY_DN1232_c0_g1_i3:131-1648(+)